MFAASNPRDLAYQLRWSGIANYVAPDSADPDTLPQELPVLTSDRPRTSQPGMAYKTWRYASAVVGLTTQQKLLVACLDTGCVMTIIDA